MTLDTNNISIGNLAPCTTACCRRCLPPAVAPVENVINCDLRQQPRPGAAGFRNLTNLSPGQLAIALTQLSGEAGTGTAQAGTQAMNSFLSLVTNPFGNNRVAGEPAGQARTCSSTRRRFQRTSRTRARSAPLEHLGRSLWRPKQRRPATCGREPR